MSFSKSVQFEISEKSSISFFFFFFNRYFVFYSYFFTTQKKTKLTFSKGPKKGKWKLSLINPTEFPS
jgi:hypothetical protein